MYRVIEPFFDLMDGNREYHPGDTFPREGLSVSDGRISELATDRNRLGFPVIEEVPDAVEEPKPRKRVKKDVD